MSDTDSFIEEVSEEVRRDKLFAVFRKYGWIAIAAVLLLVGGAAYSEWSKARETAKAQAFGDAILAALEEEQPGSRISALEQINTEGPRAQAVLDLLVAAELSATEENTAAAETLREVASNGDVPEIYRQIASFKALTQSDDLAADQRRLELEVLATPGSALRLLAEEQLALMDIEAGETDAAIAKLQAIADDAETTTGLRRRATQLIVALGGEL